MDPIKVARLLDRLFHQLDNLAQLHGIQKIDVIGDAYLAASNLLEEQECDHAARMAAFASAAISAAGRIRADEDDAEGPCIALRGGLHCGPAAAALLGTWGGVKYTLVGDSVNLASRMESSSRPGRVQCSAAAAALIARQAPGAALEPRAGGVHIKGKGHMPTFWLGPGPGCAGRDP